MNKGQMLYEGKAKRIYQTNEEGIYWVEYKDDATAFNGAKKGQIANKGFLNNKISALFFQLLKKHGIENHFVQSISENEQLIRKVEIVKVEVVVRNVAAGSLAKRLGLEEGTELPHTIVEFYYKDDALNDPFINDDHISILKLATPEQIVEMKSQALKVNQVLRQFMKELGILLVDFKLEFGIDVEGKILLADEISPDTCRFWDAVTKEKLDKDRFRQDLGGVEEAYQEILKRLEAQM
ncbi:phosphoribosylaminoimidazolesuccinocarboxamide synthase [Desulfuribacillus stibiiarsenatis]|uniref:Phosphoribosylaminoimidazole-succinocarboxamide synthase n=1 Tax=Desulfuribacillus stibiiarsenatis TaxID=1390249 RepID=A0A1E5L5F9_9FIRM|nr:phosphoribosylaminoimidazolesuccinocarboxamide synthase [Desulfuribacillus stibiiarsenatis]OEH85199.1 phosphoribosylaminoimidazolesuccinocarboxamide synthase [Desulfuribacillus stibiiarsenatis]